MSADSQSHHPKSPLSPQRVKADLSDVGLRRGGAVRPGEQRVEILLSCLLHLRQLPREPGEPEILLDI